MTDQVSITVLLFAKARELVGSSLVTISCPSPTNYQQLVGTLVSAYPVLSRLGDTFVLSLNEEYIDREQEVVLRQGDELAVIPPISGG